VASHIRGRGRAGVASCRAVGWFIGVVVMGWGVAGWAAEDAANNAPEGASQPLVRERWDLSTTDGWTKMLDQADVLAKRRILSGYGGVSGSSLDYMNGPMLRAMREEKDPQARAYAAGFVIRQHYTTHAENDPVVREAAGVLAGVLDVPEARWTAVYNLQYTGAAAAPALPGAVRLLADAPDDVISDRVVDLIEKLGPAAVPAADELGKLLGHENWKVRAKAARCLRHVGSAAGAALPALVARLKDERREVAVQAAGAIRAVDPGAVPEPNPAKRFLPGYVEMLRNGKTADGMQAIVALEAYGPDGAEALPALIDFILAHGSDEEVEHGGLFIGGVVLRMGAAAVPQLRSLLRSPEKNKRAAAATFFANLTQFVPEARVALLDAVPELVERLGDEDTSVREGVASVLRDLGPAAKTGVPRLLEMLDADELRTTATVVEALVKIEPGVLEKAPRPPQVRRLVMRLVEKLEKNTEQDDYWLTSTLQRLGRAATPAVPAMIRAAVRRSDGELPETAYLMAIKHVGPAAVPDLTASLEDRDPKVRLAAVMALEDIKPRTDAMQAALARAADDPDPGVNRWAKGALRRPHRVGPRPRQ
jgi:HEAT repeat protein